MKKTKRCVPLLLTFYLCICLCACADEFDWRADEAAERYVADLGYDYYEHIETDRSEDVWAHYTYYGYTEDAYLDRIDIIYQEYQNKDHAARLFTNVQEDYDVVWKFDKLIGEWKYNDGTHDFYVKIIEINDKEVTLEYDLKNVEGSNEYDLIAVSSNGVTTRNISNYGKFALGVNEEMASNAYIWIYGDNDHRLTHGVGSGVSVDGYFLEKQN